MSSEQARLKAENPGVQPTKNNQLSGALKKGHPLVFVRGIQKQITREEVRDYLSNFGQVLYFSMPFYHHPRDHKGFAKAYFSRAEEVDKVLSKEHHEIRDTSLTILPWVKKNEFVTRKEQSSEGKVFIEFLEPISDQELSDYFKKFGKILHIGKKVNSLPHHAARGCGFVIFVDSKSANIALAEGTIHEIGGKTVYLYQNKSSGFLGSKRNCSLRSEHDIFAGSLRQVQPKKKQACYLQMFHPDPFFSIKDAKSWRLHAKTDNCHCQRALTNNKVIVGTHAALNGSFASSHFTKPTSNRWHHLNVKENHYDHNNLFFRRVLSSKVSVHPLRNPAL